MDMNRRLAMIAIDNAVALTIKTYLGQREQFHFQRWAMP
jgi:hypothetical protein